MITVYVLTATDLFAEVLNAVTTFMRQDSFLSLLRITALIGLIMVSVSYLKRHDPMTFVKWVLAYILVFNLVILPKTTVQIVELSGQNEKIVDNVPVVFAITASLITTVGTGLAQTYDSLLSLPGDLKYTNTGVLFGSRFIQAAHDLRIINPQLKEEMNNYFRSCVVGDIRLNQKYSMEDLKSSSNIWQVFTSRPSPLRRTDVVVDDGNGKRVKRLSCLEATPILHKKLQQEIHNDYTIFGMKLFGTPPGGINYENLFNNFLRSSSAYYKSLSNSASDTFLQSMMINAMSDGIKNYQAFTGSTASVVNNQFTKSQVQHRWSWLISGEKATWFLPLLHTILTVLCFGLFPLIVVLATLPGGTRIVYGYLQILLSLQFWPVLFAILNAAMTLYGSHRSIAVGDLTMVNLEKIDELHADLAGVAGYVMLLIPFLARGLVSSLSEAFGSLATTMTQTQQSTTLATAGEAASGSFALGQTTFNNASANNLAANKHDSNYTNMHGLYSEQNPNTGVVKTTTKAGAAIYDASPGMSKLPININDHKGLSSSLNSAYEESQQAAVNEQQTYQSSISNFAHKAVQFSQLEGHEQRLGTGIAATESGQYSQAIATMTNIASDVAKREGISNDEALTTLLGSYKNTGLGLNTDKAFIGKLAGLIGGVHGNVHAGAKYDRSSTSGDRYNQGSDTVETARKANDFNDAFNYVNNFTKNNHLDNSYSNGASLINQMGADLRNVETASHNYDASKSRSERIQQAQSYVEANASNINTDLTQTFPAFVATKVGAAERDRLFSHPGDSNAIHQLQSLGSDFLHERREALIAAQPSGQQIDNFYQHATQQAAAKAGAISLNYKHTGEGLKQTAHEHIGGISSEQAKDLYQKVDSNLDKLRQKTTSDGELITKIKENRQTHAELAIEQGKKEAKRFFNYKEEV